MKTKRFLSILLSLVLVLGMLPDMGLTASAAGETRVITPTNTSGRMTITLTIAEATHSVTITAGENMTTTGNASQTDLSGAMTDVVYTAADGYYFPENYVASCTVTANSGVSVTRDSYTQIKVSGTPTADAEITLANATAKENQNPPETTGLTVTNATNATSADGVISGVTTAMEYSLDNGASWTAVTGTSITGLNPGNVQIRLKGDDTHNASEAVTVAVGDQLADAKTAAKAELDALLDGKAEADYDADDWAALNQAITDGKAAIDNATTIDAVTTAKTTAVQNAPAIKTKAEKLADAKTAAKAELDALLDGKAEADYDADDWAALNQAITDGKAAIDNATTIDDVTAAKSNTETAANAVKTTTEKKEEADTAAATDVSDTINALPAADEVTITDKEAIEAARAAYNALTADQQAKISADTLKKLTDAEDKLVILQVMSEVSAKTGMTYSGSPIQLINTPTTALPAGYTMKYAVTTTNSAPADNLYTTSIPTATNAGTYYVWYKAVGDADHNDLHLQQPYTIHSRFPRWLL